jgi:hypothetical protein
VFNGIVTLRRKKQISNGAELTTNMSNLQLYVLESERSNCCRRGWAYLGSQGNYVVLNIEARYTNKTRSLVYTPRNETVNRIVPIAA